MIGPDIIAAFETRRRLKILKRVARCELAWKITISILVCVFPVSHIAMGSKYLHQCPVEWYIPIYLIVLGCFAITIIVFSLIRKCRHDCCNKSDENCICTDAGTKCTLKILKILIYIALIAWSTAGSVCIFRNYKSVNLGQSESLQYCHRALYLYAFWTQTMGYVFCVIGFTIVTVCNLIKKKLLAKIPLAIMRTVITEKDNVGTTTTTIWHTAPIVGNNVMIELPWWVDGLDPPDMYETHSVESDDKVSDTHMDVQEGESFGRSDTPSIDLDDKLSNTQIDSPEGETLRRSDTPSMGSDDKLSNTRMDEAKGEQSGQSEPPRVTLDDKLSDTNMGEADDEIHSADLKENMADIQIDGQEGEQSEPIKTEYTE